MFIYISSYSILAWYSKYWNILKLKVCTGTVCNVLALYFLLEWCSIFMHSIKVFSLEQFFNVLAQYQGVTLEQCSIFLHSNKVLHWNSFQCSCTVSKFTRTVFFFNIPKCSVLVSPEQCTDGTAFQCFYNIHECVVLMCCTGTVFNCYLSTLG